MSTIPERLEKLRAKMQEKGIDIYIIPTADFHLSEYVGEHFKAREYITGFTGSAGTAVVSKTEARLLPELFPNIPQSSERPAVPSSSVLLLFPPAALPPG